MNAPEDLTQGVPPEIAKAVLAFVNHGQVPPQRTCARAMLEGHFFDVAAYCPPTMTMAELKAASKLIFNTVPGNGRGSRGNVEAFAAEVREAST